MSIELGQELNLGGKRARVVRLVLEDHCLFQPPHGKAYVQKESYAQLLFEDGKVDFMQISSEKVEYAGPISDIEGLEPFRRKEVKDGKVSSSR